MQRLHALDIATGQDAPGSPVTIAGSVAGTAPDSTIGADRPGHQFDPKMQGQRAGLALVNGVVLIAWAAHEDLPPYHGWIMAFDATTLARVGVFCRHAGRLRRRVSGRAGAHPPLTPAATPTSRPATASGTAPATSVTRC